MKKIALGIISILFIGAMFFTGYKATAYFKDGRAISLLPKTLPPQPQLSSSTTLAYAAGNLEFGFCSPFVKISDTKDLEYCKEIPKVTENKGVQINLTDQKAIFLQDGKIIKVIPIAYQSPENIWFQTPTGYYKTGVKHKEHRSSLFPVNMPYAIQIYEDFFMHEIPFYDDGTRVTSKFSGGCIRFETQQAAEIFEFLSKNDQIVLYKTFQDLESKKDIVPPIDTQNYWIRQRFNNPLRQFWNYSGNLDMLPKDYYQHAGMDFSPNSTTTDLNTYAIYDGEIAQITTISEDDHGMGNTVIIKHEINGSIIYALYAHLDLIKDGLQVGQPVSQKDIIGIVGNSGYGCRNYWKIGPDGCDKINEKNDTHLHFELKTAALLSNPEGENACENKDLSTRPCYGYTPDNPEKYGYINPLKFLFEKKSDAASI